MAIAGSHPQCLQKTKQVVLSFSKVAWELAHCGHSAGNQRRTYCSAVESWLRSELEGKA